MWGGHQARCSLAKLLRGAANAVGTAIASEGHQYPGEKLEQLHCVQLADAVNEGVYGNGIALRSQVVPHLPQARIIGQLADGLGEPHRS